MNPQLCLSLFGDTVEVCRDIAEHPEASLYEIRLDLSSGLDLQRVRASTTRPLIIASHCCLELLDAAAAFADAVDVGPHPPRDARSIVSVHEAEGDPDALWTRYSGDHITKIVLETQNYYTISKLLSLNRNHPGQAVCFAMGEVGAFSRILSGFEGAPWIYTSLEGRPTAPGQFTLHELVEVYRLERFNRRERKERKAEEEWDFSALRPLRSLRFEHPLSVFGIVGDPVSHSRSPAFHNSRFAESGLPWIYVPLPCRDLQGLFACAQDFGMKGFSVTHPHKEAVLPFLDIVSEEVRRLRSCNTVCYRDGRWQGINTDVVGIEALLREVPLAGARMVLLGAGSSARAVASIARPRVRQLCFLNRTLEKARQLAAEFQATAGTPDQLSELQYDVLFQTTPVGLKGGECPISPQGLRPGTIVIDAIYQPAETELLKCARALGCRTFNGEAWFLAQAEAQFQWWRSMQVLS
ncbi:MAG TPA: type I 3-dehydroquinate dehydratase [Acidobacteriota bacterium]|nr:type I 3-dehydroquinate dehydratase [Acidobacteriota bacterium]